MTRSEITREILEHQHGKTIPHFAIKVYHSYGQLFWHYAERLNLLQEVQHNHNKTQE